jgi:hypothetical protein
MTSRPHNLQPIAGAAWIDFAENRENTELEPRILVHPSRFCRFFGMPVASTHPLSFNFWIQTNSKGK